MVDMTLGAGGHAEALLSAGVGRLVGIDRDPTALAIAGERLAVFGERFQPVRARFSEVDEEVVDGPVDGVLFDLGVSSMQLDRSERGFSYRHDGPLDMRMGDDGPTAADLVNELPEKELADLIFEYGQEPKSRRIAAAIVRARSRAPIEGTDELAGIVVSAVGRRPGGPHPARRTFQALRIAVNREIEELAASLPQAVDLLAPGGRVVVIAYHSLEDRVVEDDVPRGRPSRDPHEEAVAAVGGRGRREPPRPQREAPRRRARRWRRRERPGAADRRRSRVDPSGLPEGWALAPPEPVERLEHPEHPEDPERPASPARTPAARPRTDPHSRSRRRARRGLHSTFMVFASLVIVALVLGVVAMNALFAQTAFAVHSTQTRVTELGGAARRARHRRRAPVVAQQDRGVGRALPDGAAGQRGHPACAAVRTRPHRRLHESSGGATSRRAARAHVAGVRQHRGSSDRAAGRRPPVARGDGARSAGEDVRLSRPRAGRSSTVAACRSGSRSTLATSTPTPPSSPTPWVRPRRSPTRSVSVPSRSCPPSRRQGRSRTWRGRSTWMWPSASKTSPFPASGSSRSPSGTTRPARSPRR